MQNHPFSMIAEDGQSIEVCHWQAEGTAQASRGIVEIVHGMAETAKRYEETAAALVAAGFEVFALDLRGHGESAKAKNSLGYAGADGHNWMVKDIALLGQEISRRHPGVPLFLMGHSMGSFLVQKVMYTAPGIYDGFMLTGTCGQRSMIAFGEGLARLHCALTGDQKPSMLLNAIVFGPYNRQFTPVRTPFDWLTRDTAEVDKFVQDPCCGELCSAGFFRDFFHLLSEIHQPGNMERIPRDKPIFIFCGEQDPVGLNGKGARRLIDKYKELGVSELEWKFYPEARHELLHEINREEVIQDMIHWLEEHTAPKAADSLPV